MSDSQMNKVIKNQSLIALLPMFLLAACDSSSSGGSGSLSLNITDAPVDSAAHVVVAFNGVSIKPADGSAFDIDFIDSNGDPEIKTIDLLDLQGPHSAPLLLDHTLAAGHYNWLRLKLVEAESSMASYIELEGGTQHPLYVPSGDQTGLKLNRGFDITDGGAINFTIDFDLRKSVLEPNLNSDAYKLKPTLRIVDNANVGHLAGTVGSVTLTDPDCDQTDYAVYVFSGNTVVDDVDGQDAEPVTTALLSDTYEYAVGFLEAGDYTLSFTCQAGADNSEEDDNISFIGTDLVTVTAGAVTQYNFD